MAEKILTIFANSDELVPRCIEAGTRGSFGTVKLRLEFSDEWDGMTKKIVFHPKRGKPIEMPYLGGEIDIPAEVMRYEGQSQYVVSGVRMNGSEVAEKRISLQGYANVEYTLDDRGGNATPVTPESYDLLLAEAQEYIEESLRLAKESGEFDGADGKDGKAGVNGVGINLVRQTATSAEDGGKNVVTVYLDNGISYTFEVRNGSPGRGIRTIERTSGDGSAGSADEYTITFTDGSTTLYTITNGTDKGVSAIAASRISTDGKYRIDITLTDGSVVSGDLDIGKTPASTSELKNDSGFITKSVSDLANYYLKGSTYSREEIDSRISAIPKFAIRVVNFLPNDPDIHTIYLVGGGEADNLYTEYINVDGKWEILGSQIADKTRGSKVYYAICETAGETNPKMAYTVTRDFVLERGARVGVWFKYNNIGAQNLNVDDTGTFQWISARKADGTIVSDTPTTYKAGGQLHWFTFDGEYWIVDDSIRAGEDTVGKVSLSQIRTEAAKNHHTKAEIDNKFSALDTALADKANKAGWTANKYLGTDASGNMVEKEAPQTGTGGITEETDPTVPSWAKQAKKPTYTAEEVGARPNTWMPTATDVGALPDTTQIPAATSDLDNDSGYITIAVATLLNYYLKTETYAKTETYSQTEVDNLISGLDKRLNAIADSGDVDLDQMSELVAYIKANKSLIDSITTSKVNVSDIVDNLTTADSKKPLSAAQGKALKAMYDALPAWAKAANKPTYSKSDVGLGNVDNVKQYSANNPPPYPVKSVNGKTGAVTLGAADVGAATTEQFGQLSKEIADYGTALETEVTDRKNAIADLNARLGQQTLLIAEGETMEEALAWLETNGDKTRAYLMPDDFFYMWKETTEVGGIAYTNLLPLSTDTDRTTIYNGKGYKENTRLSGSGGGTSTAGSGKEAMCTSGFIFPVKAGDILRIKGAFPVTGSSHYVVGYDSANARTGNDSILFNLVDGTLVFVDEGNGYSGKYTVDDDGTIVYTINTAKLGENVNAIRVCMGMDENTIVTLNEEIKEGGGTVIVEKWASTGHTLTSTDFSDAIARLITITDTHTAEIKALEKAIGGGSADETEAEALEKIKTWDKPVYDTAEVTLLNDDRIKPALTNNDRTIEAIYAKYRALRDDPTRPENALYITESNLGLCTTSDLVPEFEGKDILRFDFREPDGLTEVDDPDTPQVPEAAHETKPKLIFLSGIHKEWAGVYALYYALEEIANNPEFEDIRRNAHIIVVPCANPFGLIAEYTATTNGWAAPSDWGAPSHVNANGIAPHNNFGVGYITNQNVIGAYNHSGSSPYSELETQYIDKVMADNSDAIAFITCHNYNNGGTYGCTAIWASSATYHMCNLVYRLVDKLSKAWVTKYGDTLKQSIDSHKHDMQPNDYRLGRATMSTSAGTEQQNATKYGILATNLEISDKWVVFSDTQYSSEAMTHGAEVYANFIRTILRAYDHKDRKEYAPNLPMDS